MRMTVYTDYALRLLTLLALKDGEPTTIAEVAAGYGISRNHLMKIAHELGKAGLIATSRGRGGGLRLARPAAEIGLGAVVRLTEENFHLVECFEAGGGHCAIAPACRLQSVLAEALAAFLAVLDRYTLADLVREPKRFQGLLGDALVSP